VKLLTSSSGLRAAWAVVRNFHADRCLDLSAGLAFYSVLSLPTSLYLLFLVLSAFLPEPSARGAAFSGAAAFFPAAVAPTVARLEESLRLGEGLVFLAVPSLLWTASSAFVSLEHAVNHTFGTVPERGFWGARLKAFAGAVLAGAVLAASVLVAQITALLDRAQASASLPVILTPGMTAVASRWLLTCAAFSLLYKVLPRGRVGWLAAFAAGSVSATLWEAARSLFGSALERSPAYGLLSGSLAGLTAFLMWIYTATALVLLGAEIAAWLNGNRRFPVPPAGRAGVP
jgi:membrane protein